MDNNKIILDNSMQSIAQTIWNGRTFLLIIGIVALIASVTASLFIKNQYKATATIYPPVTNQISKELLTENKQEGLTSFGETEEMEQFLQILNSRTLKDKVIVALDLRTHWGIKNNNNHVKHLTYKAFTDNVKVRPTQYQSINIEVMDRDPEWAALIANTVVNYSDTLMRSIKAQVATQSLQVLENQYKFIEQQIEALQDSLSQVMAMGVIEPKRQANVLYREYLRAIEKNNIQQIAVLQQEITRLQKGGAKYLRYSAEIKDLAERMNELKKSLIIARIESNQEIPTQFIVDRAEPTDKKAYPKRSLIVVTATLSAMLFAAFALLLLEYIRKLKKQA